MLRAELITRFGTGKQPPFRLAQQGLLGFVYLSLQHSAGSRSICKCHPANLLLAGRTKKCPWSLLLSSCDTIIVAFCLLAQTWSLLWEAWKCAASRGDMSYRAHDCASAVCLSAFGEALTAQLGWCHSPLCLQFMCVALERLPWRELSKELWMQSWMHITTPELFAMGSFIV